MERLDETVAKPRKARKVIKGFLRVEKEGFGFPTTQFCVFLFGAYQGKKKKRLELFTVL